MIRTACCDVCGRTIAQVDGEWLPLCSPTPPHDPQPLDRDNDRSGW